MTTDRKATRPRWLRDLVSALGEPEADHQGGRTRWMWHDGEVGVVLDRLSRVWQVVAFGPARSVTLRTETTPNELQIRDAVALAGLSGYKMVADPQWSGT